jgi:hypothetical protein
MIEVPAAYDPSDWRNKLALDKFFLNRKIPEFWDYTISQGCFWVVNLNLFLARRLHPRRLWRIVYSDKHATVWDGRKALFDMNFLAFGAPVREAWGQAALQIESVFLNVDQYYLCKPPVN